MKYRHSINLTFEVSSESPDQYLPGQLLKKQMIETLEKIRDKKVPWWSWIKTEEIITDYEKMGDV